MANFGKDLIEAMVEAAAQAQGKTATARVHAIDLPNVHANREALGISQQAFAGTSSVLRRR